jgi:hypothetical protein
MIDRGIGEGVVKLFKLLIGLCVVFIPLGVWKLIDLIRLMFR